MKIIRLASLVILTSSLLVVARSARANDRRFTYTYESAVLPEGARELEVWNTARLGRNEFYSRFDQRLEFEVGLTNRLQTSLYLNYTGVTAESMGVRTSAFEFGGVSSEWKYKLKDPVADALGFALYGEATLSSNEAELEGKLIFDKRIDRVLLAANVVCEVEWEFAGAETEREEKIELDLAGTYSLTPSLWLGVEARSHSIVEGDEVEFSALFAGPVLAYATPSWWVAFSFLPQLPALKAAAGQTRELVDHEKFNARLLFSFHL